MPLPSSPEFTSDALTRVPPWFRHTISRRGTWNLCVLEQSCFGPMHDLTPSAPFHHFGVRLDRAPLKMGWILDGARSDTDLPSDYVSVIPAGASLKGWWDRPVDLACLYFTPAALTAAAGEEVTCCLLFVQMQAVFCVSADRDQNSRCWASKTILFADRDQRILASLSSSQKCPQTLRRSEELSRQSHVNCCQ
jgi:hypothetical protein